LPDSDISHILTFLETFKTAHSDFALELLSNNLESAYIEIFSKSLAKDNPQKLIYEDPNYGDGRATLSQKVRPMPLTFFS
jgi:hypothetical protein